MLSVFYYAFLIMLQYSHFQFTGILAIVVMLIAAVKMCPTDNHQSIIIDIQSCNQTLQNDTMSDPEVAGVQFLDCALNRIEIANNASQVDIETFAVNTSSTDVDIIKNLEEDLEISLKKKCPGSKWCCIAAAPIIEVLGQHCTN